MQKEEEAKLKLRLTPEQYKVCINKGTEIPFTGEYWDSHEEGIYQCVVCGNPLFDSDTKFDSGTGWPSFWKPIKQDGIKEKSDRSFFFIRRTEVQCANCDSHLGHVFDDGPAPTGLRYCINSAGCVAYPVPTAATRHTVASAMRFISEGSGETPPPWPKL